MKDDLLYRLGAAAEGEERAYLGDVSLLLKEAADEIERLGTIITSIRDEASNLLNCPPMHLPQSSLTILQPQRNNPNAIP